MHEIISEKYDFQNVKCFSEVMKETVQKAKLFSKHSNPILLTGESGTGKKLIAKAIHHLSSKSQGPLVTLNCSSLNQSLLEIKLFGTDGKIARAQNGTLFIDKVSDLSLLAQGVLLRAIEEHELLKNPKFRIICSTSKDLKKLAIEKLFRWDLYYRIAGLILEIPPLRNRKNDIEPLSLHFLFLKNYQNGKIKEFCPGALNLLKQYHWPGNIREMKNIVESAFILAPGNIIDEQIIKDLLKINNFTTKCLKEKTKKANLPKTLASVNGNVTKTAEILGVSRTTIYRWLNDLKGGK